MTHASIPSDYLSMIYLRHIQNIAAMIIILFYNFASSEIFGSDLIQLRPLPIAQTEKDELPQEKQKRREIKSKTSSKAKRPKARKKKSKNKLKEKHFLIKNLKGQAFFRLALGTNWQDLKTGSNSYCRNLHINARRF